MKLSDTCTIWKNTVNGPVPNSRLLQCAAWEMQQHGSIAVGALVF